MKKLLALLLAIVMVMSMFVALAEDEKPSTWIADRTIRLQCYVDDIGYSQPSQGIANTPVGQKIKEMTGITLEILYTEGESDATVMAAQLASGNIPDAIVSYLNNSTRHEFPVLNKAAQDGLFWDMSADLGNMPVLKQYLEEGYLGYDTEKNIVFREDYNGAVYFLHLAVDHEDESLVYDPEKKTVGGMWIRKDIAEALNVDVTKINTSEDVYQLLVQIKEGHFTDDEGNEVVPLGPKYWGSSYYSLDAVCRDLFFGVNGTNSFWGVDDEGNVQHEVDTEYIEKRVMYVRKLLAEGLMHKEWFSMDTTRAGEVCYSKSVAIIGDCSNYIDVIYGSDDYIPLYYQADRTGYTGTYSSGKGGYCVFAISADAENPVEILQFMDFLSSYEGQLLGYYGVEGLSYNMVDGYPVLTEEIQEKIANGERQWLRDNVGADFGGNGFDFFAIVTTDGQNVNYFGESRVGAGTTAAFARAIEIANTYQRPITAITGLDVTAYYRRDEFEDFYTDYQLLPDYGEDMFVAACYADTDEEALAIIESWREQLHACSGFEEFKAYMTELYHTDPHAIQLFPYQYND